MRQHTYPGERGIATRKAVPICGFPLAVKPIILANRSDIRSSLLTTAELQSTVVVFNNSYYLK